MTRRDFENPAAGTGPGIPGDLWTVDSGGAWVRLPRGVLNQVLKAGASILQWGVVSPAELTSYAVRVTHSIAQSIASGVETPVAWGTEAQDSASMHDTAVNNSRLIAVVAGTYKVYGIASWGVNSTGSRMMEFRVNGTTIYRGTRVMAVTDGGVTCIAFSLAVQLALNDYVEMLVYQNSTVSLNLNGGANGDFSTFGMNLIGA